MPNRKQPTYTGKHVDANRIRSRGYEVQRTAQPGDTAEVMAQVNRRGEPVLLPGDVVKIEGFSNAGFQGILAHVRTVDGVAVYNVQAGLLDPNND